MIYIVNNDIGIATDYLILQIKIYKFWYANRIINM